MLPTAFTDLVNKVYPKFYDSVLQTFERDLPTTFRVNLLKTSIEEVLAKLKEAEIKVKEGPFSNSFIVVDDRKELISKTELVKNGEIYMQELSSMIPPIIIDPKENQYILDLTAAPGSKTTQLCVLTQNKANILANEKSYIRYQKLLFNLKLQGCDKVKTTCENGIFLSRKYPELNNLFDVVMLDSPCSSEGRFYTENPKSYKYWNLHKIKEMASVQKGLLASAIKMVKPGGFLLYSTCTINPYENEANINWLLSRIPDTKIEDINLDISNRVNGLVNFEKLTFDESLNKTVRIIPNDVFGAFYIAKIRKI